ncbi:battenin, partial [Manacus candei]|uniref:battenin n=1 Tax=Manacus candei TaxID=415023 RepID=UPI002226AD83
PSPHFGPSPPLWPSPRLQLCYQLGVFVSRSSSRCLRLRRLGGLALLQVLLAAFLLAAVLWPLLPSLGVASALLVGEGLVGGGAYANTFLNLAEQVRGGGARAGGRGRGRDPQVTPRLTQMTPR